MGSQRILLTGGAGFIGSHLAEALLRRGAELTIVDNLDEFYSSAWKKKNLGDIRKVSDCDFQQQDICDYEAMRRIVKHLRPETVIHLAARAGVRPSIENPRLYDQVNVMGTLNLLEVCRETGTRKFVFGSSSSVYGATSVAPFSEDHLEGRPISPYAASKLAGEMYSYTYAHLYGISVTCLRFFTVYGPRQRPDLAIHKFTAKIESGEPIPVFGDGSSGRDYTHVDDIVSGVLAASEYNPKSPEGVPFDVFNLGNSHPVKLSELLTLLEKVTQRSAVRKQMPVQPGDVPLTWADVSKAERLLNYRPRVGLEEGLRAFVAWYRATRDHRDN
jgi:UDP-glucuronate 4-epimerase